MWKMTFLSVPENVLSESNKPSPGQIDQHTQKAGKEEKGDVTEKGEKAFQGWSDETEKNDESRVNNKGKEQERQNVSYKKKGSQEEGNTSQRKA